MALMSAINITAGVSRGCCMLKNIILTRTCSVQSVFWLEEADRESSGGGQKGWQGLIATATTIQLLAIRTVNLPPRSELKSPSESNQIGNNLTRKPPVQILLIRRKL